MCPLIVALVDRYRLIKKLWFFGSQWTEEIWEAQPQATKTSAGSNKWGRDKKLHVKIVNQVLVASSRKSEWSRNPNCPLAKPALSGVS